MSLYRTKVSIDVIPLKEMRAALTDTPSTLLFRTDRGEVQCASLFVSVYTEF